MYSGVPIIRYYTIKVHVLLAYIIGNKNYNLITSLKNKTFKVFFLVYFFGSVSILVLNITEKKLCSFRFKTLQSVTSE